MKSITLSFDAGPVVVKKLALNDYAKLLTSFKKLPGELSKFIEGTPEADLRSTDNLLANVPGIIANAIPEFCEVLSVCTDKSAEFHGTELGLYENIEVLSAALQINDYQKVIATIKKLGGPSLATKAREAVAAPAQAPAQTSTLTSGSGAPSTPLPANTAGQQTISSIQSTQNSTTS